MIRYISFIFCVFFISGCAAGLDQDTPILAEEDVLPRFELGNSELSRQILDNPKLASTRRTAEARSLVLLELAASRRVQVGVSANAGGSFVEGSDAELAASATTTVGKILHDGGKLEARMKEAALAVDQARLDYILEADALLQELFIATVNKNVAEDTLAIIDRNLSAYYQREPLITAAAKQGVLTNSDLLSIRTTKSEIETRRLEALFVVQSAQNLLDQNLSQNAQRQMADKLAENNTLHPNKVDDYRQMAIALGVDSLFAQSRTAELTNAPDLRAQAQLTLPGRNDSKYDIFAGLTWSWTISDGGASKASQRRLILEREAAQLAEQQQVKATALSTKTYTLSKANMSERLQMLRDRVELSKSRLEELETLFRAGRTDVASIARELLAGAEAEISSIALEGDGKLQHISTFSAKGGSCALVNMCDLLDGRNLQ